MKSVTVITAGHLSTCPRMVKAADTLHEAGYDVRVVSTSFIGWGVDADADLRARRSWRWTVVPYGRDAARMTAWRTGARTRGAGWVAGALGARRVPWPIAARAFARMHVELTRAAAAESTDLIYAGTSGALTAAFDAARAVGARFALDLEDLHTAEREDAGAARYHALAGRVLSRVLPDARFVTTSSAPMAAEYARAFDVRPAVVHNVVPLPERPPTVPPASGRLQIGWFSQTIGPGRGIELVIEAVGLAGIDADLHLRGRLADGYAAVLSDRAARCAPRLGLHVHTPVPPDALVASCRDWHIGVSSELPAVRNHQVCLGNKALAYLAAGLAVALTGTEGHAALRPWLDGHALWFDPSDPRALAEGLARWDRDRAVLAEARQTSWDACRARWHWEHAEERGRLLALVAAALE